MRACIMKTFKMFHRAKFTTIYCFLLLSLERVSSNSVIKSDVSKICTHRGKGVQLFSHSDIGSDCEEVSVYSSIFSIRIVATWTLKNGTINNDYTHSNYNGRVYMSRHRNIYILDVERNDSGKYCIKCNMDSNEPEVELNVSVPLTVYIDQGEMLSRPLGSNATITCSVSGSGTISVDWIGPHVNALMSNTKYTVTSYNINTRKSSVTISVLSMTESGLYTCLATDGFGSTVQDSITLTAYDPLSVSIDNGFSLSSPIGTVVTITCSVCGFGTNSIVWIGPVGNTLTSSTKYTVTSYNTNTGKSTLTIFALSTTDSGLYICQATDRFGSTAQDYLTLTVYVPLSVSIDNGNNITGVSGGSITITCSVSGTGTITITWVNPLGNIISSGPKYIMSSYYYNTGKTTLTIQLQSMSDVGTYTCQASDSITQLEDSIYVTTAVLTVVIKETILFANVGDTIVMNCTVTGSYQSINWYLGNTLMSNGQKYQISQSTSGGSTLSSLTIFNVQYSDATLYVCQAVSSIDGVTIASDSVTLSTGDNSHHLKSDSLESDSLKSDSGMTTDYIIIAVLSAILAIIIIIIVYKNRKYCPLLEGDHSEDCAVKIILPELQEEVPHEEVKKGLDDNPVHKKDLVRKIHAHRGKGVQLFLRSDIGSDCEEVSVYSSSFSILIVATWTLKNGTINNDYTHSNYSGRVYMSRHRNIYILDVERNDSGKYCIKCNVDSDEPEVELNVFDQNEICPGNQPTLDELNIKVQKEWTPRQDNLRQIVPSHHISDQYANYYSGNQPTLDELGVTLIDERTPTESIQLQRMPSHPSSVETDPLLDPEIL